MTSNVRVRLGMFMLGVIVGLLLLTVPAITNVGWSRFGYATIHAVSKSDRAFYAKVLAIAHAQLLTSQAKNGSLPVLPNEEFERKFIGPMSGFSGNTTSEPDHVVEYANNAALHFADDGHEERVVVVLKAITEDGKSIHILTSQSYLLQSADFDPALWTAGIAGKPIPYEKLKSFVWTNLNSVALVER